MQLFHMSPLRLHPQAFNWLRYEAGSLFRFHKKKNFKPVIYLGLPKTSSTYLYHSFECAENYLKSSVKEWFYLRKIPQQSNALNRCSTDNRIYSHQRNLLISFREHINFYIDPLTGVPIGTNNVVASKSLFNYIITP